MNDATYMNRLIAAEKAAKALKDEVVSLLAYAIKARQTADDEDKRMFRHDTTRLDNARIAVNNVIGQLGRID